MALVHRGKERITSMVIVRRTSITNERLYMVIFRSKVFPRLFHARQISNVSKCTIADDRAIKLRCCYRRSPYHKSPIATSLRLCNVSSSCSRYLVSFFFSSDLVRLSVLTSNLDTRYSRQDGIKARRSVNSWGFDDYFFRQIGFGTRTPVFPIIIFPVD